MPPRVVQHLSLIGQPGSDSDEMKPGDILLLRHVVHGPAEHEGVDDACLERLSCLAVQHRFLDAQIYQGDPFPRLRDRPCKVPHRSNGPVNIVRGRRRYDSAVAGQQGLNGLWESCPGDFPQRHGIGLSVSRVRIQ